MENKKSKPYDCPSLLPWEHFLVLAQRRNEIEPSGHPELRKQELKVWGDQHYLICRTGCQKSRALQRKNSRDVWSVPLEYSTDSWSAHLCE